ncbi:MAG TPA: NAD(P)H-dependent oxidoreductase [Streptosporangiaceae bacterium]|jgi:FMN reductase
MTIAVVAGNPKPDSRTLQAATLVARRLTGSEPDVVIDVVRLGPGLLGLGDPAVTAAVESVRKCELAVVASPTFKASITGVLKCFLDQVPGGGLAGVTAFPVMLGAGPGHAMAPEVMLRPVLAELGASCPVRGLYLLDTAYTDEESWAPWLAAARAHVPGGGQARS